jgi:hypothetical protein
MHEILRKRLYAKAGLVERPTYRLEALRESEWSPRFESLQRNRLLMGALRYGPIKQPGKRRYDRVGRMKECIAEFEATGNLELLVDVANYCLLEFEDSNHPKAHFEAVDDGNHCKPL